MPTYDPAKVVVVLAGIQIYGYAEGTFVKVERNERTFSTTVGCDGQACDVKSNNKSGKITVTLKADSSCNDKLSARLALDEATGMGSGEGLVKTLNGTALYQTRRGRLEGWPNAEYGKELSSVEWVYLCHDLEMFNGGLA